MSITIDKLKEIKSELNRFEKTIDEAIEAAKNENGWEGYDGKVYGKHQISGTRISGAVKRRAIDLKYYLTKNL
jgi:hypothetical protein